MTQKPKPILKNQKQPITDSEKVVSSEQKTSEQTEARKQPQDLEIDPKEIPLMFQAQIEGRGNIQFVGEKDKKTGKKIEGKPAYERWVNQWLDGCPPIKPTSATVATQPSTSKTKKSSGLDKWQTALAGLVVADTQQNIERQSSAEPPWEYQVRWRLVSNSGQDNFIRPVIGREGMPFFPGSSMKGAFRNACSTSEERMRYCGGEKKNSKGEKRTEPGILRFHGGYPVDDQWRQQRDRLVDIVHNQEQYQVRDGKAEHNANVQISLYQTKFKFDISSTEPLSDQEWGEIKKIWENALGYGLGSRISAGYGYIEGISSSHPTLCSVHLNGWGLSSLLLLPTHSKTDEFRPNMFKAVLRGHTWRLLAGITDEATAQRLTHQLWGGIEGSAVEGCVGINFSSGEFTSGEHLIKRNKKTGQLLYTPVSMPTFILKNGCLDLLKIKESKPELETFLMSVIRFSMLLGGFGKSWRRIHHDLFHKTYFKKDDNPMIGCHWEFANQSKDLYVPVVEDDLSNISSFLKEIRQQAISWVQAEEQPLNDYVSGWRETWHPEKVQVWGRIASNEQSQAVRWFHDKKYLKETVLAGEMGKIGRIWHRMYPRYTPKDGNLTRVDKDYVELLTIFPDSSPTSQKFMDFLGTKASQFQPIKLDED